MLALQLCLCYSDLKVSKHQKRDKNTMQDSTGPAPKQLLSERIKNVTNILITVSRDPSVDELSAALALTVMLNKLDKHATAVFSGKIPPAIEFLNPEKTFEGTVDSLRDFIIALDKEKADRLRYKVEDDVVRIFITPYRTVISEKDLAFSQGDFNVELIIALGVEKKEDLDTAITAHGRILHDATVATINADEHKSNLGTIDWTDSGAGSFCEMLVSLSESLQSGILDEQIATALLTGIVSATERFSNTKTSPKVMTMAAQLMAAGANQQLIATKLEEGNVLPPQAPPQAAVSPDGSKKLEEGSSEKLARDEVPVERPKPDGEMTIEHEQPSESEQATEKAEELADSAEEQLDKTTDTATAVAPTLSVEDLKKDIAAASQEMEQAAASQPAGDMSSRPDWRTSGSNNDAPDEPMFGGTLNATTDEAHEAKEREDRLTRNRTLLSHDGPSTPQAPLNAASPGATGEEPASVDPFAEPPKSDPGAPLHYEAIDTHGPTIQPLSIPPAGTTPQPVAAPSTSAPTLSELEAQAHSAAAGNPVNDARAAVSAALDSMPFNQASEPLVAAGAQPLSITPLHDDPVIATEPTAPAPVVTPPPADPAAVPLPPPPPLPDFSTLPPLPGDMAAPSTPPPVFGTPTEPPVSQPDPAAPVTNDPGQFKLPGQ